MIATTDPFWRTLIRWQNYVLSGQPPGPVATGAMSRYDWLQARWVAISADGTTPATFTAAVNTNGYPQLPTDYNYAQWDAPAVAVPPIVLLPIGPAGPIRDYVGTAVAWTKTHPLLAVGIAVGAGLVLGDSSGGGGFRRRGLF